MQQSQALSAGCDAVIAIGANLTNLTGFDAVAFWGDAENAREIRKVLAARSGPLIPLIYEQNDAARYHLERHICIDTTASGGNTSLLAHS